MVNDHRYRTKTVMQDRALNRCIFWRKIGLDTWENQRTRHRRLVFADRPKLFARLVIRMKRKSRSKRAH